MADTDWAQKRAREIIATADTGMLDAALASALRDARREGLERAARLCDRFSVDYGSEAEGANEPEFRQHLACEAALRSAAACIRALAADRKDGGK